MWLAILARWDRSLSQGHDIPENVPAGSVIYCGKLKDRMRCVITPELFDGEQINERAPEVIFGVWNTLCNDAKRG